jgi:hypothetical protein
VKLTYYQGSPPNFGDEVNATMWSHLVPPDFFNQSEDELFVGIGSIIYDYYPKQSLKIVAGSGLGGYTPTPDVKDGSWEILWVRGPLTAAKLGIDPRFAITDSAVLLRETPLPEPTAGGAIAFMPHVDSVTRGNWDEVCRLAGMSYLDPRQPASRLLAEIRGARLVITEAMHGAIISDALRTPWIGIRPFNHLHRNKWNDWAQSLEIPLAPVRLRPSNLREAWAEISGKEVKGQKTRILLDNQLVRPINRIFVERAAKHLSALAKSGTEQLSSDTNISRATDRALTSLQDFVTRWNRR